MSEDTLQFTIGVALFCVLIVVAWSMLKSFLLKYSEKVGERRLELEKHYNFLSNEDLLLILKDAHRRKLVEAIAAINTAKSRVGSLTIRDEILSLMSSKNKLISIKATEVIDFYKTEKPTRHKDMGDR